MTIAPAHLGAVARTAVWCARLGTATWHDPETGQARRAAVAVSADPEGCLLVRLEPGSPVAQGISTHPVVTVAVAAPDPWLAVAVDGVAHAVPRRAGSPALFRLAPSGVTLRGGDERKVPVAAYYAAPLLRTPPPIPERPSAIRTRLIE